MPNTPKFSADQLRGLTESRAIQHAASYGMILRTISRDGRHQTVKAEPANPKRVNVHVARGRVVSVAGVY